MSNEPRVINIAFTRPELGATLDAVNIILQCFDMPAEAGPAAEAKKRLTNKEQDLVSAFAKLEAIANEFT